MEATTERIVRYVESAAHVGVSTIARIYGNDTDAFHHADIEQWRRGQPHHILVMLFNEDGIIVDEPLMAKHFKDTYVLVPVDNENTETPIHLDNLTRKFVIGD
jgi:hypothetical protein